MMAIDEAQASGARLLKCCQLIGLGVRTIQRWRKDLDGDDMRMGPKSEPKNKYSKSQRVWVLAVMNQPAYRDLPPSQIVPRLADIGRFVASESSMRRFAIEAGQNAHRGKKKAPSKVAKPKEKIATGPGQVFSWDITYLRTPIRGAYFFLYMMLDVWSRKIVGHVVHDEESSQHAAEFVDDVHRREGSPRSLILHQDNGSPMTGSTLVAKLQALQIEASYSRPRVSNDNPFSESLFGTMKTRPAYPSKPFATIEEAQAWVTAFVTWYNDEHRHSAICFVTPSQRHSGQSSEILRKRRCVYEAARRKHPHRWSGETRKWKEPRKVFLNRDKETPEERRA